MEKKYYLITYKSGARGCPTYFHHDLNHDWQWDEFDPDPDKFNVTANYICQAKHKVVNFDFLNNVLVSERFIDLCEKFGLKYRKIAVEMVQSTKVPTEVKYYFLLSKTWAAVLDYEKSKCTVGMDLETGTPLFDNYFPTVPHIEAIQLAVIDEEKVNGLNIFRCIDIESKYVCSERFKAECEEQKLSGIEFVPLDSNFKSIPFWMT
jgi:hypothetical protein